MGMGASVLRQDMEMYSSLSFYTRLNSPGKPYHGQVIEVTLCRIPDIEIEVLDRELASRHGREYPESDDYGHVSDYDYDSEEELEEWLRVTRF